jgi:hypothetical protein
MDSTLLRAGRTTHLKVLAVALAASIAIVVVGLNARSEYLPTVRATADNIVVKAAQPGIYAGQEASTVR